MSYTLIGVVYQVILKGNLCTKFCFLRTYHNRIYTLCLPILSTMGNIAKNYVKKLLNYP